MATNMYLVLNIKLTEKGKITWYIFITQYVMM